MKSLLNQKPVINVFIGLSILCTLTLYILSIQNQFSFTGDGPDMTTDIDQPLPNTLPYFKYQQLKDSIKLIRMKKNGEFTVGGALYFSTLGVSRALICDSCNTSLQNSKTDKSQTQYYINLPGWTVHNTARDYFIGHDYVQPFVKNGVGYLRQNGIDRKVNFRFDHHEQHLLIPVSARAHSILFVVVSIIAVTAGLFMLYIAACFINFLVAITKANVFSDDSLRRLLTIGTGLLFIPIGLIFSNLLIGLIFHSYFSGDVIFKIDIFKSMWKITFLSLIFLLLYRAFKKGKELQDEHDLTI